MQDIKPLYMANCVEDLEKIAVFPNLLKSTKAQTLENCLKSLYNEVLSQVADQEKCFILCLRYLYLFDKLCVMGDRKFMLSMYASQLKMVLEKLDELRSSLPLRYRDEQTESVVQRKPIKEVKTQVQLLDESGQFFKGDYISCKELYAAMESKVNMLLVDIRGHTEYVASKIKYPKIINIPDIIIKPGLSANTVGLELINEAKYLWDKRDQFEAIVFLDWNSSSSTVTSTKLAILKAAVVEWDCLRNYPRDPIILDGGFIDFVDSYPALVTNVHTIIARRNEDIDELLELDSVIYPKSNVSEMHLKEFTIEKLEESFSSEDGEESPTVESLADELPVVGAEESKQEAADRPIEGVKKQTPEEGKETVEETRQRLLKEARINKNKSHGIRQHSGTDFIKGEPWQGENYQTPPLIRREMKPAYFPPGFNGWCGLMNIRNTCYMNTVLQCLKCVPVMRNIFSFTSHYENLITRQPPAIIHEFAHVVRELWEGTETQKKLFVPQEFYQAVCTLDNIYGQGNHEDCMEFFLFLFNHLNEDCAHDIKAKRITIEREKAWYEHLQGRTSIWVDLFYHQFHVTRICEACGLKADTYEIDNTLMVSFPNNSPYWVHLNQLIAYSMSRQKILDFKCTKCEHLGVYTSKTIVVEPEILVVVLKRYYQSSWQETKKSNRFINFDRTMQFGRCTYRLHSLAEHQGTMASGHYYAHGFLDNKWIEFNDAKVGKQTVDWSTVKRTVCAFFYCKINKAT